MLSNTLHRIGVSAATLLAAAATCIPVRVAAAEPAPEVSAATADSVAAAFATAMAQYLKPEIQKSFTATPDSIAEYMRGVAHAFDIKNVDAPYYLGVRSGMAMLDRVEQMQQMGFPITNAAFCAQLGSALTGSAMGFDVKSADAFLQSYMQRLVPEPEPLSPQSQADYLADQRAREGVIETPSGLLFEVITEGEGATPTDADRVSVTYAGRLSDGTVFDSTERPVQFPVADLVPGFTEGLKMMKAGGEYRIIIPASLGYGDKGAAGVIPPGAVLDFTIRLLDVVRP